MGNKRFRQVYDNIYGYIDFDRDQFDIILKNPYFLRLHNLKQMGLAYYVYPDALHTRYAHSLGVYSAVNRIIDAEKYFDCPIENFSEQDKYKIKLSALLHDIGHLPLSHTIESALEEFEDIENESSSTQDSTPMESESDFLKNVDKPKVNDEHNNKTKYNKENKTLPKVSLHEKLGEYVLEASGLSEFLMRKNIASLEISAGFKGDVFLQQGDEIAPERISFYAKQIRNFLHSQLDADRIDYLLRDSGFSGVKSGNFDIDKLLTSIRYDEKGNYGIDESSVRAIEQFFISRFVAYCQIVGNKKVMAFEFMAKDFYLRLLKLRKQQNYHLSIRLYSYKDLTTDILKNRPEEFLAFTDDYFFSLVREVIKNKQQVKTLDPIVVKYAEMITNVTPLAPVTYCEIFKDKEKEPCYISKLISEPSRLEKISQESGVPIEEIIIPKPLKIVLYKNDEDPVEVFKSNNNILCENISDSTFSLLSYLNSEFYIYRVYTFEKNNADKLREAMTEDAKDFKFKGDL